MSGENPRRLRLRVAVKSLAALIAAGFAYLLIASVLHQGRAPAPRLALAVSTLAPGAVLETLWDGRRVLVVRRTPAMLAQLASAPQPLDPLGGETLRRSAELLALVGYGPASGCPVQFVPGGAQGPRPDWSGGFRDACANLWYDAGGDPLTGSTAPLTLVPQHAGADGTLILGEDSTP